MPISRQPKWVVLPILIYEWLDAQKTHSLPVGLPTWISGDCQRQRSHSNPDPDLDQTAIGNPANDLSHLQLDELLAGGGTTLPRPMRLSWSSAVSQISWMHFRRHFSLGLANAKACCSSSSANAKNASAPMRRVQARHLAVQLSIVNLLGFTADYSAVITPPLFCCEPHGFGTVATTPVHPALYQCLFPLRARH